MWLTNRVSLIYTRLGEKGWLLSLSCRWGSSESLHITDVISYFNLVLYNKVWLNLLLAEKVKTSLSAKRSQPTVWWAPCWKVTFMSSWWSALWAWLEGDDIVCDKAQGWLHICHKWWAGWQNRQFLPALLIIFIIAEGAEFCPWLWIDLAFPSRWA